MRSSDDTTPVSQLSPTPGQYEMQHNQQVGATSHKRKISSIEEMFNWSTVNPLSSDLVVSVPFAAAFAAYSNFFVYSMKLGIN